MITEWSQALKNLLLPIFCKHCGIRLLTEENGFFCPDCWEGSPRVTRPFCTGCGKPHPGMAGFGSRANFPCVACREEPKPHIDTIRAAARFEDAIEQAIKLFKFSGKRRLAGPLSELLEAFILEEMADYACDLVIPVPLHPVRQRDRGYNQSLLLADQILPLFPGARLDQSLKRIRPTRTQSRLSGKERAANVQGAFAVVGDPPKGQRILLVDDVVTTAGTVTECARVLRKAGASHVDVLAVALTP